MSTSIRTRAGDALNEAEDVLFARLRATGLVTVALDLVVDIPRPDMLDDAATDLERLAVEPGRRR